MVAGSEEEQALPVEANYLEDWPLRPWLLAGLGAVSGLIIHLILESEGESGLGAAIATFFFFAFVAATFVLRPTRLIESAIFALGVGAVMGGIAYIVADLGSSRAGTEFAFAAGVFFSLLAIPLFQAAFHRRKWATPYAETHFHVWTDAVSAGGALAFVGLSWLVLWLLHALFSIVGIEVIEKLIETDGFVGAFMGATFGGAMGVLRNQLGVLGTLQRVVMLVFALLAVPFAVALLIFLTILLFSGGSALWEATDSATPVLLSCAVFAFIFCNAIVRDDDEARSGNVVMQAAALVLAACILPLAIFAAISMGIRIDQHGLTPERIWALIAIVIATAYGLAYWAALVRGRMAAWCDYLRRANMHLAAVTCVIALILALPLFDFGAISTRDQLARLESGETPVEEFDFNALRWDFGDAGGDALAELAQSDDPDIAQLAQETQNAEGRYYGSRTAAERREVVENTDFGDMDEATRAAVGAYIRDEIYLCEVACRADVVGETDRGQLVALIPNQNWNGVKLLLVTPGNERAIEQFIRNGRLQGERYGPDAARDPDAQLELRPFEGRQLYVGDEPVGDPFE
ncbi:DUF4153 domain-containing protein [Aurantiacibacter sp. D1-12]|uniref:DUF4153 domain-containing protein n=1 Tax=Aurantiacibacter sp. D1-12 TaxID=2993658 RepID=UPI00237CBBC7|nr:DUF4153 domain-containing protein [Aurantiacibacter sp. D1-12]MDE1467037.1 DUF4153 domain-containing protein [Aurantiacibacter sp. D1-12]